MRRFSLVLPWLTQSGMSWFFDQYSMLSERDIRLFVSYEPAFYIARPAFCLGISIQQLVASMFLTTQEFGFYSLCNCGTHFRCLYLFGGNTWCIFQFTSTS
jgi:hypothetical protein